MGVKQLTVPRKGCEQALRGNLVAGREKEGEFATTSLEFEYLHWKSQCKMLIGRDVISNDVITLGTCFHVFYNVCLHLRWFPLCAHWRKSDSSVDGEPQGNWRWNSYSRDVVASSPNYCLLPFPAPLPERLDLSVSCPTNSRHFFSSIRVMWTVGVWERKPRVQCMCLEE